jgi:hypothetical protein
MKKMIYLGAFLGGIVGGYIPSLWGASVFDLSSIFWGTLGTILGIWIGYKVGRYQGL